MIISASIIVYGSETSTLHWTSRPPSRDPACLINRKTPACGRIPLGLFVTGTMSMVGPNWYNITTGKDDNRDSIVNDRPAGVPRNSGPGPKTLTFNFNISKAFFFGASHRSNGNANSTRNLNVFANVTNAFNRTNVASMSGVMSSPNVGRPTGALDPRQIEAGMRFQF